jgi:hypothetical protein
LTHDSRRKYAGDFSYLFYVNKECEVLYKKWIASGKPSGYAISEENISKDLKQIAEQRRRLSARIWAGFQLTKTIPLTREKKPPKYQKVLNTMRKWGLAESSQNRILPTQEGLELGRAYIQNAERGRLLLYNTILKHESDIPFSPRNFLLKLRDYTTDKVEPEPADKNLRDTFHKIVDLKESISGEAFDDKAFVRHVNTNYFSFDVMRDWAIYFEFINSAQLSHEEREYMSCVAGLPLYRPRYRIYLVSRISTFLESISVLQLIRESGSCTVEYVRDRFGSSRFTLDCVLHNLVWCGILTDRNGIGFDQDLLARLPDSPEEFSELLLARVLKLPERFFVFSDWPSKTGLISTIRQASGIPPTNMLVFGKPQIGEELFLRELKKAHLEVSNNDALRYAWIPAVRQLVCRRLRLSNHQFDAFLSESFRKRSVALGTGAGEIVRTIGKRGTGRKYADYAPLIYQGNPYTMVRPLR